jgi:hypothetical protein
VSVRTFVAGAALVTASAVLPDANPASDHTPQARAIGLHAAGMIDVVSGARVDDALVVVTGDRIAGLGPAGTVTAPSARSASTSGVRPCCPG